VYVYQALGMKWSFQTKLFAADGAESDQFGMCMNRFNNTVMIGAWGDDGIATNAGIIKTNELITLIKYLFVNHNTSNVCMYVCMHVCVHR
jgi:hypothetical protein